MATQKKTKKNNDNKKSKRTYSNISISGNVVEEVDTKLPETTISNEDVRFTFDSSTYEKDDEQLEEQPVNNDTIFINTNEVVVDYEYLELEKEAKKMLSIPEDRNMSHTDWLREIIKLAEYAKDISIAHKKLSDSINSKRVLRSAQFNARWTS